jgi:very-short-patch-repair endonuclease
VVTRAQIITAGLRRGGIDLRLRTGRLHPIFRGVYLVGHTAEPPLARMMGAVLAYGQGALLSHRSAAELWGLISLFIHAVDVTVDRGQRRSQPGIVIHRSQQIAPKDRRRRNDIPVTSPARTLLDFAEVAPPRELERAFDEAQTQRLIRRKDVEDVISRSPGRHGIAPLRRLLDRQAGPALTESEAEERLFALIRQAGLPEPEVNVTVGRYRLDFFWRTQRLNVEVDGYRYHSTRAAFERDHRRDAELEARGIRVRRVTWHQLMDEPMAVVARIALAVGASAGGRSL